MAQTHYWKWTDLDRVEKSDWLMLFHTNPAWFTQDEYALLSRYYWQAGVLSGDTDPFDPSNAETFPLECPDPKGKLLQAVERVLRRCQRDGATPYWRYQVRRLSHEEQIKSRFAGIGLQCVHDLHVIATIWPEFGQHPYPARPSPLHSIGVLLVEEAATKAIAFCQGELRPSLESALAAIEMEFEGRAMTFFEAVTDSLQVDVIAAEAIAKALRDAGFASRDEVAGHIITEAA